MKDNVLKAVGCFVPVPQGDGTWAATVSVNVPVGSVILALLALVVL